MIFVLRNFSLNDVPIKKGIFFAPDTLEEFMAMTQSNPKTNPRQFAKQKSTVIKRKKRSKPKGKCK